MARAKLILSRPDGMLVAVYGGDAQRAPLEQIAAELSRISGVVSRVTRVALDRPDAPPTLAICMGVAHGVNGRPAVMKFKRLTSPQIPYTLGTMSVKLLLCACGYVSTSCSGQFVNGLEPNDQQRFWLSFYERMARLSVDELLPHGLVPPYEEPGDVIERIARDLGAYPSQMYINPQRDMRPCRHS